MTAVSVEIRTIARRTPSRRPGPPNMACNLILSGTGPGSDATCRFSESRRGHRLRSVGALHQAGTRGESERQPGGLVDVGGARSDVERWCHSARPFFWRAIDDCVEGRSVARRVMRRASSAPGCGLIEGRQGRDRCHGRSGRRGTLPAARQIFCHAMAIPQPVARSESTRGRRAPLGRAVSYRSESGCRWSCVQR